MMITVIKKIILIKKTQKMQNLKVACSCACIVYIVMFVTVLRFNIPVNNFSVMSGPPTFGINQYSGELMSCSTTQHCAASQDGIQDLLIWSLMLYHYTTSILNCFFT